MNLGIIGAGGHAKVVIETARAAGHMIAFVADDAESKWGTEVLGCRVVGSPSASVIRQADACVLAIGGNRARQELSDRYIAEWATIVHPSAILAQGVQLGAGTVVMAGVVVQPDTVVGRHSILNTGCSVDHDCTLGDFVHVAPGARLAGGVTVGDGALIGIGSCVAPGMKVGDRATVGAGAAVVEHVPVNYVVVGVPAR